MSNVDFNLLDQQLHALLDDQSDALADTANFVALIYQALDDVNWLGVYVLRGADLVLGPFQGLAACVRIPLGKGVCGDAAARRETLRVADVHAYPGHIACDLASRSEIVVPLVLGSKVLGVLDVDSPSRDRFSQSDQDGLELLCRSFSALIARHDGFI